jgi:hypothetical protein
VLVSGQEQRAEPVDHAGRIGDQLAPGPEQDPQRLTIAIGAGDRQPIGV